MQQPENMEKVRYNREFLPMQPTLAGSKKATGVEYDAIPAGLAEEGVGIEGLPQIRPRCLAAFVATSSSDPVLGQQ
jgi:hypothetical protein